MKTLNKRKESLKVHSEIDSVTGEVTMYFAEVLWGPVVTGTTHDEAKELFRSALRLGLIISNISTVNKALNDAGVNENYIREMASHNREFTSQLEFA